MIRTVRNSLAVAGKRLRLVPQWLAHPIPRTVVRLLGIALLVVGLQGFAFSRSVGTKAATANDNLQLLLQEVVDHKQVGSVLDALRSYSVLIEESTRRREVEQARDLALQGFTGDPRAAIEQLSRAAVAFEAGNDVEQEALDALRLRLNELQLIYKDHYRSAIDAYTNTAWYFQPAAVLGIKRLTGRRTLLFNHAVYLMLVGDYDASNSILVELGESAASARFRSRIFYSQARLQYDVFERTEDLQYFAGAIQYTRQSVIEDANYAPAKLFLEFLLASNQSLVEVPVPTEHGQGHGEGKGKRGAIAPSDREF